MSLSEDIKKDLKDHREELIQDAKKNSLSDDQKKELENLKIVQMALADAHFKLSNRVQYLPEEFDQALKTIGVLVSFHMDITKKVHEIEPPPPKEEQKPQKPYVMDITPKVADEKETH